MTLDQLVVGPMPLTESRFDVPEGLVAVILQNGRAVGVRDSGRVGGLWNRVTLSERRLPWTGNLQYMLFSLAPMFVRLTERDIPLDDGSYICAIADVRATPLWATRPSTLLDIVRERGIVADEYRLAANASLQADFRALIRASLMHTGHGDVLTTIDNREVIVSRDGRGLLSISEILDVQFERDAHVEALDDLRRGFAIEAEQARIEEQLFELRSGLELARADLQSQIGARSMLSLAQAHQAASDIYAVPAWAMAYPDQLASTRERHQSLVTALLTEYADVVPLLAESMETTPDGVLRAVLGLDLWAQRPTQLESASLNATSHVQRWGFSERARAFVARFHPELTLVGAALAHTAGGPHLIGISQGGTKTPDDGALFLAPALDDPVETAAGVFEVVGRRLGLHFDLDATSIDNSWIIKIAGVTLAHEAADERGPGKPSTDAETIGPILAAIAEILDGATPAMTLQVE